MKLEINKNSENYVAHVIKLPVKQHIEGMDNVMKVTVFGNDCIVSKNADENVLYLFFPAETKLSGKFLYENNLYRNPDLNRDKTGKPGFFEENGRVKAIKMRGNISTGFVIQLSALSYISVWKDLKVGDQFNKINDVEICSKYTLKSVSKTESTTDKKKSKAQKKLERFDKLIENQFKFHDKTNHLALNLHRFNPTDLVLISDKWHGTSAIFSNVLTNRKLSFIEKIAKRIGVNVVTSEYSKLYASRSVLKNRYINKEQDFGYYSEDVWKNTFDAVSNFLEEGITLYGEIVGYTPSGKGIQSMGGKVFDYGCERGKDKFVVYRITYTKPNGSVIEFSWRQIKSYCRKYGLNTVVEFYYGFLNDLHPYVEDTDLDVWRDELFAKVQKSYNLEQNCSFCANTLPAEGVCIRIDGRESFETYKLKSKRFIKGETDEIDAGNSNLEDES